MDMLNKVDTEGKETKINKIRDEYSICLQFYDLEMEELGDVHLNKCISLIHSLKEENLMPLPDLQFELISKVHSISNTKEYSIVLV